MPVIAMRTALLLAACVLGAAANAADLGDVYVQSQACPFEGCSYGEWAVKKQSIVRSEPTSSSRQVGTLEPGSTVKALTGEVHVVPGIAEIVGNPYTRDLDPEAVLYLLDPVGEGRRRVYQNGTFYVTKVAASNAECEQRNDPRRCWVKVLKEPKMAWWVKVQLPRGTGWVLIEGGNLEPTDSLA
jgi:hypothetical protein